jgi:hypothetical protein
LYSPIPLILKVLHIKIFKFSTITGLSYHFEYLGTFGRELLKQTLKKQDGRNGHNTITEIQIDEQKQASQKGLPSM